MTRILTIPSPYPRSASTELWAYTGDVIAVRFAYEYRNAEGQ
ncbi:DUF1348 family protein [Microbacterium arborescens]